VRSSLPRRRVSFFGFWQINFAKPLEITFFSPPHIDLRVGKLHLLPNKKCKTVGVAHLQEFAKIHLVNIVIWQLAKIYDK
jgi:hypothetical protein